jgi:hypothetical protein
VSEGLIASQFIEVTAVAQDDPKRLAILRHALPSLQRVFIEGGRRYLALVGWAQLPEDYSGYSKWQIEDQWNRQLEFGRRRIYPNAKTTFRFDEGNPLAAFFTLEYLDKGIPYRDVTMDVIATRDCVVSVKFSRPGGRHGGAMAAIGQ